MKWVQLLIFSLFFTITAAGQDAAVSVPDLTNLSVPEAAAALNRSGLQLGQAAIIAVDPTSDDPENTIIGQSPTAGEEVEQGTSVDITVTRAVNAYLLYDDNDLTLVNATAGLLDLSDIVFSGAGSSGTVEFRPTAWASTLDESRCGQLWSVARLSSKAIEGCSTILWMTASTSSQHFWTFTSGVEEFSVIQDGVVRATCPAAGAGSQDAPLRCDIVFDIAYPEEHVDYLYLAYTIDRLVVHNQTANRWMEFNDTVLRDSVSRDLDLTTLSIFIEKNLPPRLAPGECILFAAEANAQPPESCHLIWQVKMETLFWLEPFLVIGRDNYPRACEAAEEGALMICVMLR